MSKDTKGTISFVLVLIFIAVNAIIADELGGWVWFGIILSILFLIGFAYWKSAGFRETLKNITQFFFNSNNDKKTELSTGRKSKIKVYESINGLGKEKHPDFIRKTPNSSLKNHVQRHAKNRCQIWTSPSRNGRCKTGLKPDDLTKFQYHHINGKPGVTNFKNLLYICADHHQQLKAIRWQKTEEGSNKYKYMSQSYQIHRSYFRYCKENNSKEIQKLNKKYFEIFKI